MRRLFPLALLLLACPSKKDKVGEPLDAAILTGSPDGWELTPQKLEGYLRYQKATLVHAGLDQPAAFDGGTLKTFEDKPEAHADFDEWARTSNGLTEDDVKRLDQMMAPLTAMTVLQMSPSIEDAEKKSAELTAQPPGEHPKPQAVALNDGKTQLDEMKQRYGDKNVRLLMTRQLDLAQNWLKLTGVKSGMPENLLH